MPEANGQSHTEKLNPPEYYPISKPPHMENLFLLRDGESLRFHLGAQTDGLALRTEIASRDGKKYVVLKGSPDSTSNGFESEIEVIDISNEVAPPKSSVLGRDEDSIKQRFGDSVNRIVLPKGDDRVSRVQMRTFAVQYKGYIMFMARDLSTNGSFVNRPPHADDDQIKRILNALNDDPQGAATIQATMQDMNT